jgi:hypothetical protein
MLREVESEGREHYRRVHSRSLTPEGAYTLLMRFLSNPCPRIAMIILERRDEFIKIARDYEKMLESGRLFPGYIEGVKLFLRALEQVEIALDQYGYSDMNSIEDEIRQGLKIPRDHQC